MFGSVARGRADRQSDIDLWVLAGDRADQHRATGVAKELGQERFDDSDATGHRRSRRRRYDRATNETGDRYEFQILVETPESARTHVDRLEDVFADAITLVDSDTLRDLKSEVLNDA